jgi:cell division protein FtsI/penicillin-binding protein 2
MMLGWLFLLLAASMSYVRIDLGSDRVEQKGWVAHEAVPVGSLNKPFVALAYAQEHGFVYPRHRCTAGECWLPRGHGLVGIEQALAQSCNVYFRALRLATSAESLAATGLRLGLGDVDRSAPEELLRAYVELHRRGAEPGVGPILAGLHAAARGGTAKLLGVDALAKTGTAPCTHTPRGDGDGFAVVLYPAVRPRTALLVRLHDRPGSHAAQRARALLP